MAIWCQICVFWYIDMKYSIFVITQQELVELNARIQGGIADRERVIQSLPQVSQAHKVKRLLNNRVRNTVSLFQ